MVIDGIHLRHLRESRPQDLLLINVVAAGGVKIHLLEQNEIRLQGGNLLCCRIDAFDHTFGAFCPGFHPTIHKEGEIIGIGAKADILRHDGIFLAQPHRQVSLLGIADL